MALGTSSHRLICCSILIGLALSPWNIAIAAVGIPEYSGRDLEEHPILSPCSRYGEVYKDLGFQRKKLKEWPDIYHKKVNELIEEYFEPEPIDCSASSYNELLKPGEKLKELAELLPAWKDPDVSLTRLDAGRVLLEYLRIYECTLMEYDSFLFEETMDEETDDSGFLDLFLSGLMQFAVGRSEILEREQAIARESLHRALSIMGAFDRLRPLEVELECMQRFTLDLRNITALTAETSACLPRIWQTKDVLRDAPPDYQ